MCKSKKKLTNEVNNPTPKRPSTNNPKSSSSSSRASSFGPQSTSSSTTSNQTKNHMNATSSSSYNLKDASWQTSSISVSSRTSLSSLRKTIILPDQPHIYDFSEIRSATNNFLLKPLSSSSTSWRCTIRNENALVIQRKFRRKMDSSEVISRLTHICRSHHASLIKLRGASISGNYIYLVYDHVQGATLAESLRNKANPSFSILSTWISRASVALDLAHGLDYIHNSTGLGHGFVHNHIKTSSIIVTEETLSAKICHFGTAELCGEIVDKSSIRTDTKFEGSLGYMAPEYRASGVSSPEADVYAFGVVILELVSGEEALGYERGGGGYVRRSVVERGREAVEEGGVRRWVDRRLRDSYPVEVVEKMVRLGLECVEEDPEERPGMGKVVGRISQMYLESRNWADKMGTPMDLTMSLGPR